MLLTSPVLESFILEYCRPFDDDMILKVVDKFRNLEKLEFCGSHAVTRQGIELLMNENNCLKKIRIFDCDLVTEEDAKKLEKFVKDKKWDVEWNWNNEHSLFAFLSSLVPSTTLKVSYYI